MSYIAQTENLRKSYRNGMEEVEVLKGIDIAVKEAEFVSIMGPSGCGKSTLLYLLGGIDEPTSGKVLIDGIDINELIDKEKGVTIIQVTHSKESAQYGSRTIQMRDGEILFDGDKGAQLEVTL